MDVVPGRCGGRVWCLWIGGKKRGKMHSVETGVRAQSHLGGNAAGGGGLWGLPLLPTKSKKLALDPLTSPSPSSFPLPSTRRSVRKLT